MNWNVKEGENKHVSSYAKSTNPAAVQAIAIRLTMREMLTELMWKYFFHPTLKDTKIDRHPPNYSYILWKEITKLTYHHY